jgi:hypothetical protein
MRYAGTIFLMCLITKLTSADFGAASKSPMPVVMTCLHRRVVQNFGQCGGEVVEHHDRTDAGIMQLMAQLTRGV